MGIIESDAVVGESRSFEHIWIPRGVLITTWEFLRANGARGHEQLCFLAGHVGEEGEAQVTSCVLPYTLSSPGYVTLSSHAQTALVLDTLEQRDERPLMTLHTHGDGGAAGCGPEHSAIDDHGVALTPEDGVFSGIVPWYAAGSPFEFVRTVSMYERVHGKWVRLSRRERERRIHVREETVRIVPSGGAADASA